MRNETLLTGRGGHLHGRLWIGDQEPLGVVLVVHGLGDHGGRYESLARHLTQHRWSLFSFDLPGHGLSPGGRGRADSFDGFLADIACARQTVGKRMGGLPQVLLGHSMGGNLVINYALRRGHVEPATGDPVGLVLSAPMLLPAAPPRRSRIFAAWLTGLLLPWVQVRRPVDAGVLTSDSDQATVIVNDPLLHSRITVYLATQLLSQGRWALDQARNVDLPTLIMLGDDDPLIDKIACEHLSIRIGELASLARFPGQRHDLFHERHSNDVFSSVQQWLQQFVA